ncbi:MAG: hypothetical protein CVU38_07005 [Chloroflexi bacterium HGW-Chloroflexi-1]|nr:MAG: hypothetical protein CVU38_07005 [Chloroflexi bacterium HGW-Chloroflexi-1]
MTSVRKLVVALFALLALIAVGALAWACGSLPARAPVAIWTPAPLIAAPEERVGLILPPATPTAAPVELPTAPRSPATATAEPAPLPTALPPAPAPAETAWPPSPSPTHDPHLVIITEDAITAAVAAGAGARNGLVVEGLAVRFSDGKMRLTADRLRYGIVQVQNLALVGQLVAQDGGLQLETESITPKGLVTALIPTVTNQALRQYTAQWYVEEVRTLERYLRVRIRQVE